MNKAVQYASVIASAGALIAVIIAGIKLTDNNYDIVYEGIIMGICLAVLFITAVYRIYKMSKQQYPNSDTKQ